MNEFNIKRKAIRGVLWSAIERFSVQVVQFIVSIVLARLLSPNDFGLVAIVLVFSTIFQTINEAGFNTALIHKQDRDKLDYSTAFVTNLIIGVCSYLILFFAAPVIASFYENELLIDAMRLLSLNIIINAFGLIPIAIYTIRVDFKTQAKSSLVAAITSGIVGIIWAYIKRDVYALIIQQLSYSFVYVSLMWLFSKYRISVIFSKTRFVGLFRYASKLIGARLLNVLFDDFYSLAIGKLYMPATLGCYNRAQSFQQVLSKNIINIVQRVSVPMLCEAQDSKDRMRSVLLKFLKMTALIVYPLLSGLMVLSKPLVLTLLGDKWLFASEMLLYTCPVGFFYLISTFNRNIYNATGRTDLALKTELIKKAIFVCVFILTMKFEIRTLLLGLMIISFVEMLIDASMVKKQIGLEIIEQLKSILPILVSSIIMGVIIIFTTHFIDNYVVQLIVGFIVGVSSYLCIILTFNVANFRNEIKEYGKVKSDI